LQNSIVTGDGLLGALERRVGHQVHRAEPLLKIPSNEPGDELSVFVGGDALLGGDRPGLKPGESLVA
jgi:hypothetical protein